MSNVSAKLGKLVEKTLPDGSCIKFHLGDINNDGLVDQDDLEILEILAGNSPESIQLLGNMSPQQLKACDINDDGVIDYRDLVEVCKNLLLDMEKLALTDELTGLDNRRALKDKGKIRIYAAQRYKYPLSLVAIDLDFFKKINDQFGHEAGDKALCHLAEILRSHSRISDIPARVGGEEFTVLLDHTPLEGAAIFAEKIRTVVEATPCVLDGQILSFTVSLGISSLRKDFSLSDLARDADQALYKAKASGRNRFFIHETEI
jgi:diguanylate cyclase (GGDEF)-like protein